MNKPRKKKLETEDQYNERASKLYYSHGYHLNEIADRLNISMVEVYNYVCNGHKITTESERLEMINMRNIGMSYSEIARIFGKSRSCIRERIASPAKINCKSIMLTDKQLKKMRDMAIDGAYLSTIAEELGVGINSVRHRLNLCGLSRSSNKVSKSEIQRFIRLYKNGKSHREIADRCGRNVTTVGRHLRSAGYYRSKEN